MANQNGNQFPAWLISVDQQVLSVRADGAIQAQSQGGFASEMGISEDGTLWVVSTIPDPDGGGSKIYWSMGDGNWHEIKTPNPGGSSITGTGPQSCMYLTHDGDLWELHTNGSATKRNWAKAIVEVDYSATGVLWAVFPHQPGDPATLHFGHPSVSPFQWTEFPGKVSPRSISGNSNGNCYGLVNGKAYQYSQDGHTLLLDKGAKRGLSLSFKQGSVPGQDRFYMTTVNGNAQGNEVQIYQSTQWVSAGFRAAQTLATYYTH